MRQKINETLRDEYRKMLITYTEKNVTLTNFEEKYSFIEEKLDETRMIDEEEIR